MALHRSLQAASIALLTLQACHAYSAITYRWIDQQGQVHFSDSAPPGETPASEIHHQDIPQRGGDGLRAAETDLLQQLQRRTQQQQQQAQVRRLKASRERAEHQQRCNTRREKLRASRGHKNYKQYSRYLRNHCW